VAVLEGREVLGELRLVIPDTHSAQLLNSVEFLLQRIGWSLPTLELVAAGTGPGSFTGIRIGVASAIGLAQSLGIPFAGISGLDALAAQLPIPESRVAAVMDAQRAQVYFAEYERKRGKIKLIGRPALCFPSDLRKRIAGRRLYLAGDGAERFERELGIPESGWPKLLKADLFLACGIGRLAIERKRCWRSGKFLQSEPLYIRPPDAIRAKSR